MRTRQSRVLGLLAGMVLVLSACQDVRQSRISGFKGKYLVARGALEDGNYASAIRNYQNLLKSAGPLAPRLRLEYAHSLLRANRFADAAREARQITAAQTGSARLAALAVQGTADHEFARSASARGEDRKAIKLRLTAARAALSEVLTSGTNFDPLGALATRLLAIKRELATL